MHTSYLFKSILMASIAAFFSCIVINNVTDPYINWWGIKHIFSMDTTLDSSRIMWRAITNPSLQKLFYFLIVMWEVMTAVLCWLGAFEFIMAKFQRPIKKANPFQCAQAGLLAGFLLYWVGFIVIAGEWFSMYLSPTWNFQMKAGMYAGIMLLSMIIIRL